MARLTKSFNGSGSSSTRSATVVFDVPNASNITRLQITTSPTVNASNVSYALSGNEVTVTLSNLAATGSYQETTPSETHRLVNSTKLDPTPSGGDGGYYCQYDTGYAMSYFAGSCPAVYTTGGYSSTKYTFNYSVTIDYDVVAPNGKIKDLEPGTVIYFADSMWMIVDPSSGYLFKYDSIGARARGNGQFNPLLSTSVGHYLNNTFFSSLPDDAKRIIREVEWGVGTNTAEKGTLVTARVGLLSHNEWGKFNKVNGSVHKVLEKPSSAMWTITFSGSTSAWHVNTNGSLATANGTNTTIHVHPTVYIDENTSVVDGIIIYNRVPTLNLNTPNNKTLYENDTFVIDGTALDIDNGNTVTIRYQINALTTRAIKAFLSDGSTLESFSKSLTFKGGNLYDGTTLIAENLSDGVAHTLKVWATDDQGGTSVIREIPFYVVPNRAPLLTVNAPVISGNINSDKFTINGSFEDSDGNNTIVSYRLNGASSVQVAEGVNGTFEFELSFGQLIIGANEIVIEAVDSYGAKVSKTVKLNKAAVEIPLLKSTARYKINPPTGSAQAVLLWIQHDEQLDIDVSLNMTMVGEAESFVALTASNIAPLDQVSSVVEDEFYHEAGSAKDNIIVQIDMTRSSVEVSDAIHLISGVLE